ncbi:hypothetical protein BSAF29S_03671 [Bacillus safensis subsp. safensis]
MKGYINKSRRSLHMDLRDYLTNGIPRQTQDQQPGSEKK